MKLILRIGLGACLAVLAAIVLTPSRTLAGILQAIIPAAVPIAYRNPTTGVKFQLTDSSGNITTAGSITSGSGSGVGGVVDLTQGTAPTFSTANTFSLYAPTSIPASYQWQVPAADGSGCIQSNGAGVLTIGACGGGSGTPGSTLFSSTSSTGPSNSAAETTLIGSVAGSTTIAANTFTAGAILEARGQGFFSVPAVADSLTVKAKCGSTVLGSATFTPAAGVVTNGTFRFWLMLSARGTGAGGSFMTNGFIEMTGSALSPAVSEVLNTSAVAFDFTTTCVFDLTAQWGAGQVGESITGTNVAAWIPGAPVTSVGGLTGAVPGQGNGAKVQMAGTVAGTAAPLCTDANGNTTTSGCPSGGGAVVQIAQQALGAPADTVTFSAIPGTYSNLELVWMGRSSTAAVDDTIYLQFSGDTTANYVWSQLTNSPNTFQSGHSTVAVSTCFVGLISGANTPAGGAGSGKAVLPSYAATTFFKNALGLHGDIAAANQYESGEISCMWNSTAAITSIAIKLGSAANFDTGSIFTLYGVQ